MLSVRCCRKILTSIVIVSAIAVMSGCSEIDQIQKQHEVFVTLQEADRQFSIEDNPIGTVPDDRAPMFWINHALELMPHSPVPYLGGDSDNGLIAILIGRGRYQLLVSILKKAVKDPALSDNPDLLINLADAEQREGSTPDVTATYARAVDAYNKALRTAGTTLSANGNEMIQRARAEYYGGMKAQAIKDFNTIISTHDDERPLAENELAYIEALDKTNLPEAKQLATDAVNTVKSEEGEDEQLGAVEDTLAWVLHQQGDNSNALTEEEEAVSLDPLEADCQYHLGEICKADGRFDEARMAYRAAIKLYPCFPEAQAALASLPSASTS
jgi:tetratricopeptide (TPR) repeat protein